MSGTTARRAASMSVLLRRHQQQQRRRFFPAVSSASPLPRYGHHHPPPRSPMRLLATTRGAAASSGGGAGDDARSRWQRQLMRRGLASSPRSSGDNFDFDDDPLDDFDPAGGAFSDGMSGALDADEREVRGYFSRMADNRQRSSLPSFGGDGERAVPPASSSAFPTSTSSRSQEQEEQAKRRELKQQLLSQKGRLWSDPLEFTDDDWRRGSSIWLHDLPDWTPDVVSKTSRERVRVMEGPLPTLSKLAGVGLPEEACAEPAEDPRAYVRYRRRVERERIATAVRGAALRRVEDLMESTDRLGEDDLQAEIDDLFESVEEEMRSAEGVTLVKRTRDSLTNTDAYYRPPPPRFEEQIENALTQLIREINARERRAWIAAREEEGKTTTTAAATHDVNGEAVAAAADGDDVDDSAASDDVRERPTPVFIDLKKSSFLSKQKKFPIGYYASGGMVETWSLSADESSQRIMVRPCMTKMASILSDAITEGGGEGNGDRGASKIFVTGKRGVGKSAALTAVTACARESGCVVLFLPDGDRYRKNGMYVEPSRVKEGMFDLPVLAGEICQQLLDTHGGQLDELDLRATSERSLSFLPRGVLDRLQKDDDGVAEGDEGGPRASSSPKLTDLLKIGSQDVQVSSGCYSCVLDTLLSQDVVPFVVVMDEYNVYFDRGQYYHMDYDKDVQDPIPLNMITFFQPLLVMGMADDPEQNAAVAPMRRGGIVAGITHNRAVPKKVTSQLVDRASREEGVTLVEVPRYSAIEVDHILANYEATGIGKLRFDGGETVENEQEVAFLRMLSGSTGQRLLDASVMIM